MVMAQMDDPDISDWIRESEVARMLGLARATLRMRRKVKGQLPPYYLLGGNSVFYRRSEVLAWIDARRKETDPDQKTLPRTAHKPASKKRRGGR